MTATRYPVLTDPPHAIAHRGGAWEAPENSLRAFRRAVDLGFTFLETDVRATADGVAVAFHDASLSRSTDQEGRIRDLPWSSVERARIQAREPILRLEELLRSFPEIRFNLDVKEPNAIGPFLDVMRRLRAWDRVNVAAFGHDRLRKLRRMAGPRLSTAMSPPEVLAFRLQVRGRMPRWSAPPASCLQIPPTLAGRVLIAPELLGAAHEHGWQVHAWTVDDPAEMHRLLDLGVDGIMTDRPTVLRQVLRDRG